MLELVVSLLTRLPLYYVQLNQFFFYFVILAIGKIFLLHVHCTSSVSFLGHLMISAAFSNCRSFSSIAEGSKNLTDLFLNECQILTDRSLEYVACNCKKIARVKINGCQSMDTATLEHIG
jgi:hypothetical protein